MKKLLAIVLSLSFFTFNTNAQVTRKVNPSQKIQRDSTHKRGGEMMKDLNLTADQKAQMKENRDNMKQQRDAISNDASLTQDQKKIKMQELRKSQMDKMNSILTPDQKAKMQADRKDWKGGKEMKAKRDGGKMMKDLNLSGTQKTQIKANMENMKQQSEAIKDDASLTQDQKKAKMQELHKSQEDKMNSILTPDQKAKMEAQKKEWKEKNKNKKWNGKKDHETTEKVSKS